MYIYMYTSYIIHIYENRVPILIRLRNTQIARGYDAVDIAREQAALKKVRAVCLTVIEECADE